MEQRIDVRGREARVGDQIEPGIEVRARIPAKSRSIAHVVECRIDAKPGDVGIGVTIPILIEEF